MICKGILAMLIRLKEYELHCIENEIAENTLKNYMNTLKQLEEYCQVHQVEELTKEVLIEFKHHLKNDEYQKGRTYELTTCNQKITAINIYLNWAGQSHLSLKQFKQQTKTHRESINQQDYDRMLRFANEEMKLFMLCIGNTGLRISEICNLRKKDLDKSIITIENKGKSRIFDIPMFLKKKLREYMRGKDDNALIFDKTQSNYRQQLKVIAGRAKVKKSKVYPHSFRHYFAKAFIDSGGDSTTLQQLLGHSDIKTTTIYTRKSKEELAEVFRKTQNK